MNIKSISVLLIILVVYHLVASFALEPEVVIQNKIKQVEVCNSPFSEEALIEAIVDMKFKHPHIVLAQAKVETGHFSSKIFYENNNLFGMKMAWIRPTTAIGVFNNHAVYRNWRESLIDYALYTAYYTREKDEDELYAHLGKYYAEDPKYSQKVRRVVEREELNELFIK